MERVEPDQKVVGVANSSGPRCQWRSIFFRKKVFPALFGNKAFTALAYRRARHSKWFTGSYKVHRGCTLMHRFSHSHPGEDGMEEISLRRVDPVVN